TCRELINPVYLGVCHLKPPHTVAASIFQRSFRFTRSSRMVHLVSSTQSFKEHISKDQYTIVDFYANWCAPCKAIAPILVRLSNTYASIKFLKVDVDEQSEVAAEEKIKAMPTFVVYRNGQRVDELVGANQDKLEKLVIKYAEIAGKCS
ncbi:Thioredoxin-1, partial [Neolecta irregularis DAH-3]